ncbi:hypothetical protein, partial [Amphritea balenae]
IDVGEFIRVEVSFTDDQGFDEGPLYSSATAAVAAVNDAVNGLPVITGTVTEDQTLTADTGTITDSDGISGFNYQWQRSADGSSWSDISGAINNTYTLDDIDVGEFIRVEVSFTDDQGFDEGPLYSSATAAVTAVNDAVNGLPLITGTVTEDQVLTADTGAITDPDGISGFNYQWQRSADGSSWADISGAINNTYSLDDSDVGDFIRVEVSFTDDQGFDEGPLLSSATAAVTAVNDAVNGLPLITGTVTEDQILTADTGAITDPDGISGFNYQWQRSADGSSWSDISGAITNTYSLDDSDVGDFIRVEVRFTDDQGFDEGPLLSSATAAVTAVNDAVNGLPLITGTVTEDQTLTADTGAITDPDGISGFNYQWQRSADGSSWSDISGAINNTYSLDDSDVGDFIRVEVRFTDDQGFDEGPLISSATAAVTAVNDPDSGLPVISGAVVEDQILTADTGAITDPDGISGFNYQWQRSADGGSWADISGAINNTYSLDDSDVGDFIRVEVSFTDDQGFDEGPLLSSATAAVTAVNDAVNGLPLITGTVTEDQTLTADTGAITDPDGISGFNYQWQRSADGSSWADISGAINNTYTLDDSDVGELIRVEVSFTDDQGFDEGPLLSSATAAVTAVNDAVNGLPLITGTVTEDQTLTADTGAITDPDGISGFNYQWQRSADGSSWSDISGAITNTYSLDDSDVGDFIRVEVSFTDDQGFDEGPLYSSATAAVSAVNDPATGSLNINGGNTIGDVLTLTNNIEDPDGLGSLSYQWYRDGSVISGAAGPGYLLTTADAGKEINAVASFTDLQGNTETVASKSVAIQVPVPEPEAVVLEIDLEEVVEEIVEEVAEEVAEASESLSEGSSDDQIEALPEQTTASQIILVDAGNTVIQLDSPKLIVEAVAQQYQRPDYNSLNSAIAQQVAIQQFQPVLSAMAHPIQLQNLTQFVEGMEQLQKGAAEQVELETTMIGGSIALSSGLSVGYVIWLARSGVLLSSVLTSLPAWRFIDPLPILATMSAEKNDSVDDSDHDEDESLGAIIDKSSDQEGDELTDSGNQIAEDAPKVVKEK